MPIRIITETQELQDFCDTLLASLENHDRIVPLSVDTEFIREVYYYPKVCLIQMALDPENPIVIDPLGDIDLSPLKPILTSPRIVKVFHDAHHDIEVFYHELKILPNPIFDTQIAAMACVSQKRESYDKLVKLLCQSTIDKSQQLSQWDQRPLTEKQIQYATSDVTYLLTIYQRLCEYLEDKGRTLWIKEEMESLFLEEHFRFQPEAFWLTLSSPKDDEKSLKIFRSLITWRERYAEKRNVPRNFVLRKQDISFLVLHPVSSIEEIKTNRIFPRGLVRRIEKIGQPFWEALSQGHHENAPLPSQGYVNKRSVNKLQYTLTQSFLEDACKKDHIAPELLAKKSDIVALLTHAEPGKCRLLQGWRKPFGHKVMALKEGKVSFVMSKGTIIIKEHSLGEDTH